jgi:TonB-dependent receptor
MSPTSSIAATPPIARAAPRTLIALAIITLASCALASALTAQGTGKVAGRVVDSTSTPVAGALVHLQDTQFESITDRSGAYRIDPVPAGRYTLTVRAPGFVPESSLVELTAGATLTHNVSLRRSPVRLREVVVQGSPRLAETKASALARQRNADNIVSVLSGDEIRSLPNFNAAEAAGRIPGVSLERDEGEGKFVQVRGTEPRLQNVTIDGAHVPGTEADRIPKLDNVPSDLLAAIEVSKTLTADMDADAIGGSVNLVTKSAQGKPRGYIAGQFGQINLLSRNTYQGSLTYGGRFGSDGKLGVLLGGSADKNSRGINDVEPAWGMYDAPGGSQVSAPNEWSQRDYLYERTRYGLGGSADYRFDDGNDVYVRGLWSLFHNYGTRYVYDLSGDAVPTDVSSGTIPNVSIERTSQFRTPAEQMWGGTLGGTHDLSRGKFDWAFNAAGTRQQEKNYRTSTFAYTGPDLTIGYAASDVKYPRYSYASAGDSLAAASPANYALDGYSLSDHLTTGRDLGGTANYELPWQMSDHPSTFKIGFKYRDERKDFTSQEARFSYSGTAAPPTLQTILSDFSDPDYYKRLSEGYTITPSINNSAANAYEDTHQGDFTNKQDPVQDSLSSYNGSEKIYAGYLMNTTNIGALRVNLGVRVEATHASYLGHVLTQAADSAGNPIGDPQLSTVTGTKNYTDWFPSVQLRYAIAPSTNVRLAFTRGIARPNYPDLAPNQSGSICNTCANNPDLSGFTSGNPDLRAQHAWNYDLLAEHYLGNVGVISGGIFYKDLSDVILTRREIYTGPGPFNGYTGFLPVNGGHGWLVGQEFAWTQRFASLQGWLGGFGVDANYTHTESRVLVDPASGREAPLLRQSPNIANAYLTYDRYPLSGRIGWTYNGEMIGAYGDGTATANGDNYFYPHSQVDGSIVWNVTRAAALQLQVLNINNAVFGFFQGKPGQEYNFQREYYGQTFFLGARYGF